MPGESYLDACFWVKLALIICRLKGFVCSLKLCLDYLRPKDDIDAWILGNGEI